MDVASSTSSAVVQSKPAATPLGLAAQSQISKAPAAASDVAAGTAVSPLVVVEAQSEKAEAVPAASSGTAKDLAAEPGLSLRVPLPQQPFTLTHHGMLFRNSNGTITRSERCRLGNLKTQAKKLLNLPIRVHCIKLNCKPVRGHC